MSPNRTIHCSICSKAIIGYDFPERMKKLRHHRERMHPYAFKQSVAKSVKTRKG